MHTFIDAFSNTGGILTIISGIASLLIQLSGLQESFYFASLISRLYLFSALSHNPKKSYTVKIEDSKDLTVLDIDDSQRIPHIKEESSTVSKIEDYLRSLRYFSFSKTESIRLMIS